MTIAQIMEKMIAFSEGNIHDITHLSCVWTYAKTIGELERLDADTQFILEVAAITHDIACPLCKAVSWTCWPLTTLGWMMPVCSRRLPSPSYPISGSTILLSLMRACWLSPATTTSSRWSMCSSPRSKWNTSLSSSEKRPKSPSSWMSRQRRNAAGCCLPSLPR